MYCKENNIKFETQYKIDYENKYKYYDFYIEDLNLLIEADGDYWHVNPSVYSASTLSDVQIKNQINDIFKNELAKERGLI